MLDREEDRMRWSWAEKGSAWCTGYIGSEMARGLFAWRTSSSTLYFFREPMVTSPVVASLGCFPKTKEVWAIDARLSIDVEFRTLRWFVRWIPCWTRVLFRDSFLFLATITISSSSDSHFYMTALDKSFFHFVALHRAWPSWSMWVYWPSSSVLTAPPIHSVSEVRSYFQSVSHERWTLWSKMFDFLL